MRALVVQTRQRAREQLLRRFSAAAKTPKASVPTPVDTDATAAHAPTSSDPWRHFHAFESMDEYVNITLIHYNNSNNSTSTKTPAPQEQATASDDKEKDAGYDV